MSANDENDSDAIAAAIIGSYLVLHTITLSLLALVVWLARDWAQLLSLAPSYLTPSTQPAVEKFGLFQKLLIAACAAGLGGGVFMIREFYIKFAYGWRERREDTKEYLKRNEIPRYIFLPFSSVVLGPIALALAKAGAITFAGLSAGKEVSMFSVVPLSFVMGYAYHDTLAGLAGLSKGLLDRKKKEGNKPNQDLPQ